MNCWAVAISRCPLLWSGKVSSSWEHVQWRRGVSQLFCLFPYAEIEQNLREKYQQLRDLIHHLEANRGVPAIRNGWGMHACHVTSGWGEVVYVGMVNDYVLTYVHDVGNQPGFCACPGCRCFKGCAAWLGRFLIVGQQQLHGCSCGAHAIKWEGLDICFLKWEWAGLGACVHEAVESTRKKRMICTLPLFVEECSCIYIYCFVENVPQGCDAEIEELEHKLADYRDIIEQQEQMIQVGVWQVDSVHTFCCDVSGRGHGAGCGCGWATVKHTCRFCQNHSEL